MSKPPRSVDHRQVVCITAHALLLSAILASGLPSASAGDETAIPQGWVSFDDVTQTPTAPAIEIVSSTLSELVLTVTTPGVVSAAVNEDEVEYRKLEFPGYYRSKEVGHPLLPAVRQLIAVPEGCEVEVSVSPGEAVHYRGSVLYPVPATVVRYTPEGWEYLAEEFAIDEDAYAQSGYYPSDIATVSEGGSLRGQGVALLTVYPAQYDAAAMDLKVYPFLTITLSFVGGTGGLSTEIGPFDGIARGIVLNYKGMGGGQVRGSAGPGTVALCDSVADCRRNHTDFLMVVHDSLMGGSPDWPEALADHRATWNGWNVAIVPSPAIVARSLNHEMSDVAIKEFIQAVYDSCEAEHMDDGKLGYVLLVGDAKDVAKGGEHYWLPAHEQAGNTTDHWYACVDGSDNYADLMIGRLATDEQVEVGWEVQKIIDYEENATSASWRDSVLLSCGFAWKTCPEHDCLCTDETVMAATVHGAFQNARDKYFGHTAREIHAHLQSGVDCWEQRDTTRQLNRSAVDEGRHFVELCVHGWYQESHTFTWWDATVLNNEGKLPFWASYSCRTGAFDWIAAPGDSIRDCLGECLMHKGEMAGAVGYLGSTEDCTNTAWQYLGDYVWEAFFDEHLHSLGEAIAYAKLKDASVAGATDEVLMYNLLGDPAVNVFLTDVGYGDRPDYVVTPSDLHTSPAFPAVSQTAQLQAVIHNKSNFNPGTPVAVEFTLCERDGSGCDTVGTASVAPQAWSTATASVTWHVGAEDSVGHRILKVRVDPDSLQEELFRDNNEAETHVGSYFLERSGFPVHVGGLEGLAPSVAEIDTTAGPEIVVAMRDSGTVVACSPADGSERWSFTVPDSMPVRGSPGVADLDGDGSPEVVLCFGDSVKALSSGGGPFWHYPVQGLMSGPVIGDFADGDGLLEVAVTRAVTPGVSVLFVPYDGSQGWECPFEIANGAPVASGLESAPVAADLDGDGRVDAVASCGVAGSGGQTPSHDLLVAVDGDSAWSWPYALGGGPHGGAVHPCNPVVAEVDPDSTGLEVLAGTQTLDCVSSRGNRCWSKHIRGFLAGVSVADLEPGGSLEIAAATYGAPDDPDAIQGRLYVFQVTEARVDSIDLDYGCTTQPVVANLDGTGGPELVVASSQPYWVRPNKRRDLSHLDIFTFTAAGGLERFTERPLFFWGRLISTPTIKDTNDDGYLEIWLVDGEGNLHCLEYWDTGTPSRWACYQHDERHTGVYETPVAGQYPPNTTASWWGDYYMTGDVSVDSTSSLIIQPGTIVRAALEDDQQSGSDFGLVELIAMCGWPHGGTLTVGGDPLRPAVFMSAAESPTEEDWQGIRLRPRSRGVIENARISHAQQAIYAQKPDALRVTDSTILEAGVRGIRCKSNPDSTQQVLIRGNRISADIVGINLIDCRAVAERNTVEYNGCCGVQIEGDRGTNFHHNYVVSPPEWYLNFCAVRVLNPAGRLIIDRNRFGDEGLGIPNIGIQYECAKSGSDTAMIKNNEIIMAAVGDTSIGFGMYFYDGRPLVRGNTITGEKFQAAFYVARGMGKVPCLGDATAGDCCRDTTIAGCNRIVPENSPNWYVYATAAVTDTVKAECNYWDPEPTEEYFHGLVDWNPSLKEDPRESRGSWDADEAGHLPLALELLPNTPNPFNPDTVFRFALPEAGRVRLDIYDLTGRHARTLLDELVAAGWRTVTWDGRSDAGQRVASGVYFCRLEAGARELSRKVVVLK